MKRFHRRASGKPTRQLVVETASVILRDEGLDPDEAERRAYALAGELTGTHLANLGSMDRTITFVSQRLAKS